MKQLHLKIRPLLLLIPAAAASGQSYDFSELDRILSSAVPGGGTGFSVTIAQSNRTIYQKTFGLYGANTAVPIASASKWLSAAVTMALVDEGKLTLDQEIGPYFPSLTGSKARITVRQLWSHTSGMSAGDAVCQGRADFTLAQCAAQLLSLPLLAEPGTVFAYGGNSMHVGARVAEIAGGKPWIELWREKIAQPLGLTCTRWDEDNPWVSGGGVSCSGDYMRFLEMIANRGVFRGRRVLSAHAVETMQQDQTRGARIVESPYDGAGRPETRYGIGQWLEVVEANGKPAQVGSQGAFGFSPWVDLKRNLYGVVSIVSQLRAWQPYNVQMRETVARIVPEAQVTPLSVTNAASFRSGAVAPGGLLAIFGRAIGPATLQEALLTTAGRFPEEVGGTRVWIDGRPAPLLYASATQVGIAAPYSTAGAASLQLEIEFGGSRTLPIIVPVQATAPALFTANRSGTGNAAALNQDNTVNSPENPAPRGSIVALFGAGGGGTSPPSSDGSVAADARLLAAPVRVRIGNVLIEPEYAGAAPGLISGAVQINVRIPATTPPGATPVTWIAGGVESPAGVTLSVR
ncbi:MAG: serine hydrolase [Bryobacteraceae bacterium]|nr:serine hydrolase [Bryobacteraceae bacterium]